MIKNLALHLVISTGALMLLPLVFGSAVDVDDWGTAVLASIVIGVLNVSIGPILKLFTLPIKWLTLGLFTFVINAFLLWIVTKVVPGFVIDGFGTAVLAALVYSVVTWVGGLILVRDD